MTVVPLVDVTELRVDLILAEYGLEQHNLECPLAHDPVGCSRCMVHRWRVREARLRLDAASSQTPRRHIATNAVARRRAERLRMEATA